jgi:hypothetical protein
VTKKSTTRLWKYCIAHVHTLYLSVTMTAQH